MVFLQRIVRSHPASILAPLLVLLLAGSSQVPQAQENGRSPSQQEYQAPPTIDGQNGTRPEKHHRASREENSGGSQWLDPITILTGVLAIIALIQAGIYCFMLQGGRVVERAWVSLESLEIIRGKQESDRIILVGIKNSGKTPAHILDVNISVAGLQRVDGSLEEEPLPTTPDYRAGQFDFPRLLVAGELSRWDYPVEYKIDSPVANYVLSFVQPGKDHRRFWIYGYIRYRDDLTKTERRYGWIREYDPVRSRQSQPPDYKFRFVTNDAYNYAD